MTPHEDIHSIEDLIHHWESNLEKEELKKRRERAERAVDRAFEGAIPLPLPASRFS